MLSVARPYSLHALTGTSTGLCLTERWYLAGASRESTRTEVDTPPLFTGGSGNMSPAWQPVNGLSRSPARLPTPPSKWRRTSPWALTCMLAGLIGMTVRSADWSA
jgi:hypothetical protein